MFRTILSHSIVVLSGMYIVFFCIDRVNTAMNFINNGITKTLLLILCLLSILLSIMNIAQRRAYTRRKRQSRRPAAGAEAQYASAHFGTVSRTGRASSNLSGAVSRNARGERSAPSRGVRPQNRTYR